MEKALKELGSGGQSISGDGILKEQHGFTLRRALTSASSPRLQFKAKYERCIARQHGRDVNNESNRPKCARLA